MKDRQTILLVGMHRSGTSVLARMINLAGAYVGDADELVPPATDNPTGFWERRDVTGLHDAFLAENGFAWTQVGGFDLERIPEASREKCRTAIRRLLDDIDSDGRPLLIKDPRVCVALPLWQAVLGERAHYVFAVRDPRSVVISLQTSYKHAFTTSFLFALWQKYVQAALHALRGQRVLFVSYEGVMRDTVNEARRLSNGLVALGVQGVRELDSAGLALIDAKFNRSAAATIVPPSAEQARLYEWLLAQCAAPGPVELAEVPAWADPDAILAEFQQVRDQYLRFGVAAGKRQFKQPA